MLLVTAELVILVLLLVDNDVEVNDYEWTTVPPNSRLTVILPADLLPRISESSLNGCAVDVGYRIFLAALLSVA